MVKLKDVSFYKQIEVTDNGSLPTVGGQPVLLLKGDKIAVIGCPTIEDEKKLGIHLLLLTEIGVRLDVKAVDFGAEVHGKIINAPSIFERCGEYVFPEKDEGNGEEWSTVDTTALTAERMPAVGEVDTRVPTVEKILRYWLRLMDRKR